MSKPDTALTQEKKILTGLHKQLLAAKVELWQAQERYDRLRATYEDAKAAVRQKTDASALLHSVKGGE